MAAFVPDTVLVRHSELGTKSDQVQSRMERHLADNIHTTVSRHGLPAHIRIEHGRLYLEQPTESIETALTLVTQTPGVSSASDARRVEPTLDAIIDELKRVAVDRYDGGSFAVRARRAGTPDAHDFASSDIERVGGSAVWEAVADSFDPTVDLEAPDHTFSVDCRETEAYVYANVAQGPGGFPIGTQGTVVPLISGGIDSPVAAWDLMVRGCAIHPVYFDFEAYGGPDHVARAMASIRRLAARMPDGTVPVTVIPIGSLAEVLHEQVTSVRMLVLRRAMFELAERVATEVGAVGLVTGESLGQKSSQTGPNLGVTSTVVDTPIHRPLLNEDKHSIIERARELGTYTEARIDAGCNRIAPRHPETNANREQVMDATPDIVPGLLETAFEARETITIEADEGGSAIMPDPTTVPTGVTD